jgi:hypothetical protein
VNPAAPEGTISGLNVKIFNLEIQIFDLEI